MKKLTKVQKIIIAIISAVALAGTGAYGFTSYQKAQAEVDKVTDTTKKADLQKRLDLVSNAIAAKEAEAQAAAAAQAQAQGQVAVTNPDGTVTYTQPAGGTYAAPAQTGGGYVAPSQPAGNGGWVTPDLSTPQGQAQQADQNGVWSQQAGSHDYSQDFPGRYGQ